MIGVAHAMNVKPATLMLLIAAAPAPAASAPVRYVDVSVATVWTSPSAPRAIDGPVLANPVDIAAWSRALSTSARLGLIGRIQTQALYGEPVAVIGRSGSWLHVAVIDQPSPKDRRGYPGWVPARQLSSSQTFGRLLSGPVAVVVRPTARLRVAGRTLQLSFGTRLPIAAAAAGRVTVTTPTGATATLPRVSVRVDGGVAAKPPPTASQLVATARSFLGVRYLWGGTSTFGFDCSGLVNLIYRAVGIVIPRDADAQALAGRPVAPSGLRPGDVLFYGRQHVHHDALYVGGGMMIEAPDSAGSVQLVPVRQGDYAGARRYVR
jgi:cell wall-associated NlpC family hydrolase